MIKLLLATNQARELCWASACGFVRDRVRLIERPVLHLFRVKVMPEKARVACMKACGLVSSINLFSKKIVLQFSVRGKFLCAICFEIVLVGDFPVGNNR